MAKMCDRGDRFSEKGTPPCIYAPCHQIHQEVEVRRTQPLPSELPLQMHANPPSSWCRLVDLNLIGKVSRLAHNCRRTHNAHPLLKGMPWDHKSLCITLLVIVRRNIKAEILAHPSNSTKTDPFSPPWLARNLLPSVVFRIGSSEMIHLQGFVRAMFVASVNTKFTSSIFVVTMFD